MNATQKTALTVCGITLVALAAFTTVGAASADPGQASPNIPAAKASLLQAEADSAKNTTNRPKPSYAEGLAMAAAANPTPEPLTEAIVDLQQGPFSPAIFTCENMYRGRVGNRWMFVFAGQANDAQGQSQSAIRVYAQPDGGDYGFVGLYPTAANVGPLRVSTAKSEVVHLSSGNGNTFTFNLATLQYQ